MPHCDPNAPCTVTLMPPVLCTPPAVIVGVPVSLVVLLSAMLMVLLVVFVMWKRQRPMSDKEYVALPLPPRGTGFLSQFNSVLS